MTQKRESSGGHLLVVLHVVGLQGVVGRLPPVSAGEITQKC